MAGLKYWVWLTTAEGLSAESRRALLGHFASPEDVYYAQPADALQIEGFWPEQAALLEHKSLDRAEMILEQCARKDLFLLTWQDAAYPDRLRNIYDAPLLLYGKGAMPLFDEEAAVAVVGTRDCTPYGVRTAESLGYEMAREGALVVSGMAKGIDGAAHRGALRAGGLTAAVLGCGVDVIYPAANRRLYEDIAATGVLLSEYPPGTEPFARNFPSRNRIISGLSLAAVVVEAPARSGALITAETALEQGRDVFAVPGPVGAEQSVGCNRLIRDGAGLVTEGWDVLREYQARFPHRLRRDGRRLSDLPEESGAPRTEEAPEKEKKTETEKAVPPAPKLPQLDVRRNKEGLTDDQISVLRVLDVSAPMVTDDVAIACDLPMRRVLSALTMLEIDGYIRKQGARAFLRTVEIV